MEIILGLVIIVLVIWIVLLMIQMKKARVLTLQWQQNYAALEEGTLEQDENYEQQFLSFQEKIDAQTTTISGLLVDRDELLEVAKKHRDVCLPDLGNLNMEWIDIFEEDGQK